MTQPKHTLLQSHYQHLHPDERGEIQALYQQGATETAIADQLGRSLSTISRELHRGLTRQLDTNYQPYHVYYADHGQIVYQQHRAHCHRQSLLKRDWLFFKMLVNALKQRPRIHSVDSFVHTFKRDHPDKPAPSTPTVYRYIDQGLLPITNADLPAKLRRRVKNPGRRHHRLNKKHLGQSIDQRPASVRQRKAFGDWEGDLVKGKRDQNQPALMTLTERYTRYEIIVKLPDYHAQTCRRSLQATINLYGHAAFKSITFDNGSEFAQLKQVHGTQIYYAHPYSPWERGTNENLNGLIREFIPKGHSLHDYTSAYLHQVETALNHRPRKQLHYATPAELFRTYDTLYD